MRDSIDKSSSESNVNFNSGGGFSGFGFSANSNISGADFQKRMEEHGLKVNWDGKEWIAKDVNVLLVNASTLSEKITRGCTWNTAGAETALDMEQRQLSIKLSNTEPSIGLQNGQRYKGNVKY